MSVDRIDVLGLDTRVLDGLLDASPYRLAIGCCHGPLAFLSATVDLASQYFRIDFRTAFLGTFQGFQYQGPCPTARNKALRRCAHGPARCTGVLVIIPGQNAHGIKTAPNIRSAVATTSTEHDLCLPRCNPVKGHQDAFRTSCTGGGVRRHLIATAQHARQIGADTTGHGLYDRGTA